MSDIHKYLRCKYCDSDIVDIKIHQNHIQNPNFKIVKCNCRHYPQIFGIVYQKISNSQKCLYFLQKDKKIASIISIFGINPNKYLIFTLPFISQLTDFIIINIFYLYLLKMIGYKNYFRIFGKFLYSKNTAYYFIYRNEYPSFYFSEKFFFLSDKKKQVVLDIGCGIGHFIDVLKSKKNVKQIIGIDKSFLNLLLANIFFADLKTSLICVDLEKSIPLKNNSVDFIHANDSIHYIVNSNKLFSEIKRVSKKNTFISLVHINKNRLRNKELFKKSIESYKIFLRKLRYKTVLELSDKLLWERVHNYKTIILNKQQFKYRYQIFSFFASKKKLPEKLLFDKKEFLKINRINKFSYDNLF